MLWPKSVIILDLSAGRQLFVINNDFSFAFLILNRQFGLQVDIL